MRSHCSGDAEAEHMPIGSRLQIVLVNEREARCLMGGRTESIRASAGADAMYPVGWRPLTAGTFERGGRELESPSTSNHR